MRLTNQKAWDVYDGGTSAASDRNSYRARTTIGEYSIQPISRKQNVEQHLGYRVCFINTIGALPGGLWQSLGDHLMTLPDARKVCQKHMTEWDGEVS